MDSVLAVVETVASWKLGRCLACFIAGIVLWGMVVPYVPENMPTPEVICAYYARATDTEWNGKVREQYRDLYTLSDCPQILANYFDSLPKGESVLPSQ